MQNEIFRYFGVNLICWNRSSSGLLITSGSGLGLSLMDELDFLNFWVDIDNYRYDPKDWEALVSWAININSSLVILGGWFTIDNDKIFRDIIHKNPKVYFYCGGRNNLANFIRGVKNEKINS